MIGRFQETIFHIRSIDGSKSFYTDFGKPLWISTARLSPNRKIVAIVGSDNFTIQKGGPVFFNRPAKLWIIELDTFSNRAIAMDASDDVLWIDEGNTLLYSTGKEIVTYDLSHESRNINFRFSRTTQGTNALGLSPNRSKVSYLYWKRNKRYL